MMENVNEGLGEKIESCIVRSIGVWKNEMGIGVRLMREGNGVCVEGGVRDRRNDLLSENGGMLKENGIETGRENEGGIVEIERVKRRESDIIERIEETVEIEE
ncbi:toxic anion resistance protein, partial [Staphylococcus haemolyticus]|uniref:toxic anion resistance protein n=1 Tax=Staphylococcus haemolyticus TaxID=1283 RepID=UPI0021B2426C